MRNVVKLLTLGTAGVIALIVAAPTIFAAPTVALPTATARAPAATTRARNPAANPKATAVILAALTRFANGQSLDPLDKAIAETLSKLPNARATALRITTSFEKASAAERALALPGAVDLASPSRRFDLGQYQSAARPRASAGSLTASGLEEAGVMPAEKRTPKYEISYTGLACTTPSAAAGDKPLEYVITIVQEGKILVDKKSFPAGGPLTGIVAGSASSQGAGLVWSSERGVDRRADHRLRTSPR